jgi:hypothetical protein
MKLIAAPAILLLSLVSPASDGMVQAQAADVIEGTWTARYAGKRGQPPDTSRIHLQFNYDTSNMGHTWPAAELRGLDLSRDADNVTIELRREAGTIKMTGNVRARRGFGIFDFVPNAEFARQVGAAPGRKQLTPERVFAFAVHDVSRAYIQQLEALGLRNLDLDDLLAMRIHGVTPEFVTEMRQQGYTTLDHDDLVAARIHGATPAFLRELQPLGYSGLDFKDLIAFRIHGVTPDFIQELADVGYKDVPARRLVEFRIHGVDAEFVRDLKEKGHTNLTPRDLVDARIHGRRWMRRRE